MAILISLGTAAVVSFLLRNIIKSKVWVFYVLALAFSALYLTRAIVDMPSILDRNLFLLMQKCTLAEAFFIIVMFIGCFSSQSKMRQWLNPIRAQLSIIACLLSLGHIATYLLSYFDRLLIGVLSANVAAALWAAALLLLGLVLLGGTSFNTIRKRIKPQTWKRIQLLAYPFFALTIVHALFFLAPAALAGNQRALLSTLVYCIVLFTYGGLRLRRFFLEGRARHLVHAAVTE